MEERIGFVDIHSHVLPGVDDGAQNIQEALAMLRQASEEGIRELFVTPHYRQGRYRTGAAAVKERTARLQEAAEKEHISIQLYTGTEIYYRNGLEERLEKGELSVMNNTEYVLVEFSPMEEYFYIRNAAEELLGAGYRPILAHAERYRAFCSDIKKLEEIRSMGAEIQINAGSVTGAFGLGTKGFVRQILKKELADYLGTDAHGCTQRRPEMRKCAALLYKRYRKEYADGLLFGNALERLVRREGRDGARSRQI